MRKGEDRPAQLGSLICFSPSHTYTDQKRGTQEDMAEYEVDNEQSDTPKTMMSEVTDVKASIKGLIRIRQVTLSGGAPSNLRNE